MNPEIDLSGLKDLHLLTKPSFWPLAMGWWFVFCIALVILVFALILFARWHNSPSTYATRKIRYITNTENKDLDCLKKLSQLLKRVAIAVYGRPSIAPLSDEKWQDFLLRTAPNTFTKSEAHLIAFAPYENKLKRPLSRNEIAEHAQMWVKKVLKNKKSS